MSRTRQIRFLRSLREGLPYDDLEAFTVGSTTCGASETDARACCSHIFKTHASASSSADDDARCRHVSHRTPNILRVIPRGVARAGGGAPRSFVARSVFPPVVVFFSEPCVSCRALRPLLALARAARGGAGGGPFSQLDRAAPVQGSGRRGPRVTDQNDADPVWARRAPSPPRTAGNRVSPSPVFFTLGTLPRVARPETPSRRRARRRSGTSRRSRRAGRRV